MIELAVPGCEVKFRKSSKKLGTVPMVDANTTDDVIIPGLSIRRLPFSSDFLARVMDHLLTTTNPRWTVETTKSGGNMKRKGERVRVAR